MVLGLVALYLGERSFGTDVTVATENEVHPDYEPVVPILDLASRFNHAAEDPCRASGSGAKSLPQLRADGSGWDSAYVRSFLVSGSTKHSGNVVVRDSRLTRVRSQRTANDRDLCLPS